MLATAPSRSKKKLGSGEIDIAERNQTAEKHKKLVHKIVHRMAVKCNEPYDDLYQLGFIGLLKAIERFKPELGNAFSSFAVPYIQGEIQHYLRDNAPQMKTPRSTLEKLRKVRRLRKHFIALGRQVDEVGVALKLGITEEEWEAIQLTCSRRLTISWDELPCEPIVEGVLEAESEDKISNLYRAMSKLDTKHRYAISQRYLLGKEVATIAKTLRISSCAADSLIEEVIFILNSLLKNERY